MNRTDLVRTRRRRACLSVPGSNARMLEKAASLRVDHVLVDLEDAVAEFEKNAATREGVVRALSGQAWIASTRAVRVNAVGTPWCLDDLLHVVAGAAGALDCIVLPKVESVGQVHFVHHVLGHIERARELPYRIGLELQIESPRGLVEIERLACASDRVEALILGPGDYAAAAGMPQLGVGAIERGYPGDPWHYVLSRIVTTARAFALQAIDGPYGAISDLDGFREAATRSRVLGFDGKWVIHPSQIDPCLEIYTPTDAEIQRAKRLLDAYEIATAERRTGAVIFEGEMIDEASRRMAEQLVARGESAGQPAETAE